MVLAPTKFARNPPPITPVTLNTQEEPRAEATNQQPRAQRARLQNSQTAEQPAARRRYNGGLQKPAAPAPQSGAIIKRPCRALSAVRSTCMRRISCGFWRGSHAKISGGFSDDDAVRTTRAGLVSASGRTRRASAEKTPVGFGADKIHKKSSTQNARHAQHTRGTTSRSHESTAPGSASPATEDGYRLKVASCRRTASSPPPVQRRPTKTGSRSSRSSRSSPGLSEPGYRRRLQVKGCRFQVKTGSRTAPGSASPATGNLACGLSR